MTDFFYPVIRALLNAILYCLDSDIQNAIKATKEALLDLQEILEENDDSINH